MMQEVKLYFQKKNGSYPSFSGNAETGRLSRRF